MVHLNKQLVLSVLLIHGIIFIPSEAHTASTEAITATMMSSYRSVIMRRFSREQKMVRIRFITNELPPYHLTSS